MYYYILEPRPEKGDRFIHRLTDQLTDLGIAGEMVTVSAIKTVADLVKIGLEKNYSTLVAVGSDYHIHTVIASLMTARPEDRPVLGVLPTERASLVATLVGATTPTIALQILKQRRLVHATLARASRPAGTDGGYILTRATLQPPRPLRVEITVDGARVEGPARRVVITGDGQVEITSPPRPGVRLKQFLAWLIGLSVPEQTVSLLHGHQIEITTKISLPLIRADRTLTHTPATIRTIRRALKLIVARANLRETSEKE